MVDAGSKAGSRGYAKVFFALCKLLCRHVGEDTLNLMDELVIPRLVVRTRSDACGYSYCPLYLKASCSSRTKNQGTTMR